MLVFKFVSSLKIKLRKQELTGEIAEAGKDEDAHGHEEDQEGELLVAVLQGVRDRLTMHETNNLCQYMYTSVLPSFMAH